MARPEVAVSKHGVLRFPPPPSWKITLLGSTVRFGAPRLAERVGGAGWRSGLAERVGGAGWRSGLAERVGGVGLAERVGGVGLAESGWRSPRRLNVGKLDRSVSLLSFLPGWRSVESENLDVW